MNTYTCPMHPEIQQHQPGTCPKCGMKLIITTSENRSNHLEHDHTEYSPHTSHTMKPLNSMSLWEKFKMSMTMTMGMDHTGIAGREMAKLMEEDIRNKFFFSLLFTIPIVAYSMGQMIFGWDLPSPFPVPWLLFLLTTPVFFYGGWLFLYSAYHELKTKNMGMSVLIAVGITAAYGFSVYLTLIGSHETFYEAAAMLITFVLFGHWMEMKSRRGTTDALQALFNLVPPQARVIKNGKEHLIATSEVKKGDLLIIKPGDKIPVDGVVLDGETSIDESLVTGESIPVLKKTNDGVIGGSINTSGTIRVTATKVGQDTVLAQIVKLVELAQNSKAPGQKLADKFAKYLVLLAVGGGLLTFIIWYFFLDASFLTALTFAISTVVIACPDALGLATPTAVAVGTGLGAKHNILIKDAPTLEHVSKIQAIVLDKTGTLTEGKPKVTDIISNNKITQEKLLSIVAAVESKSNHPLSLAIMDEARKRNISVPKEVMNFKSLSGLGLEAKLTGISIVIGTIKLMKERNIDISNIQTDVDNLLDQGKTIMLIAVNNSISGVIAVQDPIKSSAPKAISLMKQIGLEIVMITGDNKKTAEKIAKQLGITRVFAEVLPVDKSAYVKKLQQEGKFVAMVGDGVNDAPALAQANIGIAIGAGTDVAIETANVVLMKSDPLDIIRAIRLSKATVRKMKQNLFWASIYNILAIPIAAGILYPRFTLRPEVSALLMSISSIIVATNAVLLKRAEKELVSV